VPFIAILLLAGLSKVPPVLYRAARLDGANAWQQFLHITLPQLQPTIAVAVILQTLWSLRIFDLIFVLTSNSSSTISMSGFVRREMVDNGNLGFGSAASTSLTLIIFLSAVLFLRAARVKLSEESS
jgi:trehalose/maltose transport system permease protein